MAEIMYVNEMNKINSIGYLFTKKVNNGSKKWKKHTPFSNDDEIEECYFDNNENTLNIKFKNNKNYKFFGNGNTWNGDYSFSVYNDTQEQHIQYIKKQLECQKYIIQLILNGNISNSINIDDAVKYICVLNITDEFNTGNGTNLKEVYAINVFPKFSFIYKAKENDVKISTHYILGYDERTDNDNVNVFSDCKKRFSMMHNGSRGYDDQIYEYNNRTVHKISGILEICNNLGPIISTGKFFINGDEYETTLEKIDDRKEIKLITKSI